MLARFQLGETRQSAMTDQPRARRRGKGMGPVGVDGTPEVREDKRNLATERKAGINAQKQVDVARMC